MGNQEHELRQSFPWITEDGYLDVTKFPIDDVLKKTLSDELKDLHTGCVMCSSMVAAGREEAGIYLVGLLRYYASDLRRLEIIANHLGHFHHESAAQALLGEFRRIKSSNTTRIYLNRVLTSLSLMPSHLIVDGLEELANDKSFTPRMRAKFREVLEERRRR